ncbi:4-(cytidine 5'-diphospho)-2-C-methyl-D-erythritol kinase [uncultured Alistipes sp.]|uniref:4-(cytidine 5'-diphospho)-2-C-methyl-D-erythritol kinase n=1 Tax=uncultured Alistipes sp. TaxID=538949 RepID=UPI002605D453|nr:4-(cytidine 5'-diphospho)-2-C-methyl-D-erythritol kinase [uncultured Alistipes sp.]
MKLRANCKINIGLDILRRRTDGYHDLSTVMMPVREFCDELEIDPADTLRMEVEGLEIDCPPAENLCLRAWRLMHERYGVAPVHILLRKRIPFGAGLGGGSSDATAVLCALDRLFGLHLDESALIGCAAALGSDTAFFVRNTPQLCTGRGEVMAPVRLPLAGHVLVVVKSSEKVSTREAYTGVRPSEPAVPLAELIRLPVGMWQGRIKNDFEPHVFASHPRLAEVRRSLLDAGALYAAMSGSGAAIFGIFDDAVRAERYVPPFDGVFLHRERL